MAAWRYGLEASKEGEAGSETTCGFNSPGLTLHIDIIFMQAKGPL